MQNSAANGSSSSNRDAFSTPREGIEQNVSMDWQCPFCPKKFKSSQGLGGHQNAHRRERSMQMRVIYAEQEACKRSNQISPVLPRPASVLPYHGSWQNQGTPLPSTLSHGRGPWFDLRHANGSMFGSFSSPGSGVEANAGCRAGLSLRHELDPQLHGRHGRSFDDKVGEGSRSYPKRHLRDGVHLEKVESEMASRLHEEHRRAAEIDSNELDLELRL